MILQKSSVQRYETMQSRSFVLRDEVELESSDLWLDGGADEGAADRQNQPWTEHSFKL